MNILNPKFRWVPSSSTNVADTFRRYGFKPTTDAERKAAQERLHHPMPRLRSVKVAK